MLWRRAAWGCLLLAGCGPERGWEEPEVESIACETDEPIQVSPRATTAYNFFAIGDDWSLVDLRAISETAFVTDAVIFDPCGEAPIEVLEASVVVPAGEGFVHCGPELAAWATTRDATPVPLTPSTECTRATLTPHGLLVQDAEGALQLFAGPDAAPRPIAADIANGPMPLRPSLWFAEGDLVWVVTNEDTLERHDLRSGESLVLAENVDNLTVSPLRVAVGWSRRGAEDDPGTTTVHHVATGDMIELPGHLTGFWPDVAITNTWSEMTVLDLETRSSDTVRDVGWYRVLRADAGVRSLVVAVDSGTVAYGSVVGRLDLDSGAFEPLAEILPRWEFARDPHGDGVVVIEFIEDAGRARLVRISRSGVTTLIDGEMDGWGGWALARDGRLLYRPIAPYGTASPDLHVRNPDGSDRVFARNAGLVAPQPWSAPYGLEEFPDLEGDVLVNIASGDTAALWRMPFDTPG